MKTILENEYLSLLIEIRGFNEKKNLNESSY